MSAPRMRRQQQDPTKVRLSEHFLLSDFLGCNSAYIKGHQNVFYDPDGSRLAEGRFLCESLLEPIMGNYGPLSISYGYISPDLSRSVVSYQDPNIPSYHRWDKGAAADVCVHCYVDDYPPIKLAHEIDEFFPYSRMITYSESPYICLATQISEGESPRKAFYENRYGGKKGAKPQYIKKPTGARARIAAGKEIPDSLDWKGAGYPTYHGGGQRQLQHIRVSKYRMVSDFLYSTHGLREGVANAPSMKKHLPVFEDAGEFYDKLLDQLDIPRLSIVRGFESFRLNDYPLFSWNEHFAIDFIPPTYVSTTQLAEAAWATGMLSSIGAGNDRGVVRAVGRSVYAENP